MEEDKKHLYGVSTHKNYVGLILHFGRSVICFYHLKKLKFKIRRYGREHFDGVESYLTGNVFFGFEIYKKQIKPRN